MSLSKLARKLAEVERVPLARLVVSSSCSVGSATLVVEVAMASGPSSLMENRVLPPLAMRSKLAESVSPSASVTVCVRRRCSPAESNARVWTSSWSVVVACQISLDWLKVTLPKSAEVLSELTLMVKYSVPEEEPVRPSMVPLLLNSKISAPWPMPSPSLPVPVAAALSEASKAYTPEPMPLALKDSAKAMEPAPSLP